MYSLVLIYDEPLSDVVRVWNAQAETLPGLELKKPLTVRGDDGEFVFRGSESVTILAKNPYGAPVSLLSLYFRESQGRRLHELFPGIEKMEILPRELCLVDHDEAMVDGDILSYVEDESEIRPEGFLNAIEGNHCCFGLHSRRMYRKDQLREPEEWRLGALERGFAWIETESFYHLDVHWSQCGRRCSETDKLSGVLTEQTMMEKLSELMQAPHGAVFVLQLSASDLNPDRSYERWEELLPSFSRHLAELFCSGLISRFYSPRNFLIVQPFLASLEAVELKAQVLQFCQELGSSRSSVSCMGWPEDCDEWNLFERAFDEL